MHNDYKNKHKAMYRMKWNRLSIIALLTAMCGMQMGCSDADDMPEGIAKESEQTTAPFQWTRAEDVETHSEFLRNFGVGYSYDAVRGAYCSWEDIRCQVLNRRELEKRNKIGPDMLVSQKKEAFETKQAVRYSQRDYVQSMDLTTKEEIDIGLYKKTKRNRQYVLEEGLHDCFYYMVQDNITKGEQYFTPAEVQEKINQEWFENDKSDLLTLSFQDAIKHLAWCNPTTDYAVVDSFINVWGTHVITRAMLGATMQLTLKNDMWRYKDNVSTQAFTTEELLTAYKNRKSARHQQESYTWTEQSSLYIECRGGEQSYMGTMIGEAKYDGTRDFDMSDLSKWRESVTFNPNQEKESNCEMVYMEVEPIWNFVPEEYAHVKNWLKAAILQDAALYQEMLGDRNFFSTKFPIRPTSVSCQWRKETSSWQTHQRTDNTSEPMLANVLSGGRYLATICHEIIDGRWMWVCYPIYEGKVKLTCGLGVADDNSTYDVRWIKGSPTCTKRTEKANGTFYINGGSVSVNEQEGINYAAATVLPCVELSGGVTVSGGYKSSAAYNVHKNGSNFELTAPQGIKDIVGFTDSIAAPGGSRIYHRNGNYTYIYNANELK